MLYMWPNVYLTETRQAFVPLLSDSKHASNTQSLHNGDAYQECQRGLVRAFCVNTRSGEGESSSKGQDQQVNMLSLHTQSSAVTLESSALTAQHWDQGRRVSITMVTAEHPSSAVATTPRDTDNISATLLTLRQETNTTWIKVDGAAAAAAG